MREPESMDDMQVNWDCHPRNDKIIFHTCTMGSCLVAARMSLCGPVVQGCDVCWVLHMAQTRLTHRTHGACGSASSSGGTSFSLYWIGETPPVRDEKKKKRTLQTRGEGPKQWKRHSAKSTTRERCKSYHRKTKSTLCCTLECTVPHTHAHHRTSARTHLNPGQSCTTWLPDNCLSQTQAQRLPIAAAVRHPSARWARKPSTTLHDTRLPQRWQNGTLPSRANSL